MGEETGQSTTDRLDIAWGIRTNTALEIAKKEIKKVVGSFSTSMRRFRLILRWQFRGWWKVGLYNTYSGIIRSGIIAGMAGGFMA
ncbi:hypothetical protein AVEN_126901-1 [Araneus ventricosus]|uniref:Uncharacterized protein n=1 Tax=Araneus ventricosus TaxID=182803 RepID=A0A4Y2C3W4_ARAVE|nr:hypothetical protein AVEN_126901-1 [Araneus ventricosus]